MLLFILFFCLNLIYGQPVESDYSKYKIGYTTGVQKQYPYSSNITYEFNSGKVGIRKVIIHHGTNDSIDTHRQDDYNPNWIYEHGTGRILGTERWYYTANGHTYYWNGSDWEEVGSLDFLWRHESATASPSVPIGDPITLLYLLSIYVVYERVNNKRKHARKLGETDVLDYGLNVTI